VLSIIKLRSTVTTIVNDLRFNVVLVHFCFEDQVRLKYCLLAVPLLVVDGFLSLGPTDIWPNNELKPGLDVLQKFWAILPSLRFFVVIALCDWCFFQLVLDQLLVHTPYSYLAPNPRFPDHRNGQVGLT
jgi:hypothetical protein